VFHFIQVVSSMAADSIYSEMYLNVSSQVSKFVQPVMYTDAILCPEVVDASVFTCLEADARSQMGPIG